MAAPTVHGYPGGRLTRSKAKVMSTSFEPSWTRTSPKSKTQSAFTGKGRILSEASELPFSSELSKKRKRPSGPVAAPPDKASVVYLTGGDSKENTHLAATPKKIKTKASPKGQNEEKRLKIFRKKAPLSYLEKLERATGQRMFVIDRIREGTDEVPEETIEIAGTTGNIYSVSIGQLPTCTCPDNQKGNQCKHIVYVLHKVLKAPAHLQYQLAFLSSELREIFSNAPPLPSSQASEASTAQPNNRKEVSGDCPICFTEFEPDTEEIVWCKAACGNNIHKGCFEQWARSQKGREVRCVYCRAPWQGDEDSIKNIKAKGKVNSEGYVNVAAELGLSGSRDYSTYHQPWVRRHLGYY